MKKYFGIFKKLLLLDLPNSEVMDLYSSHGANIYDKLMSMTLQQYDFDIYSDQAKKSGKSILELCCGSGRVGIHLAKQGYKMVGVDLSADMLKIYRKKLSREKEAVGARIKLICSDVLNLKLTHKFDLVILPATTITLFDREKLTQLFRVAYLHLNKNGRFVFDLRDVGKVRIDDPPSEMQIATMRKGGRAEFIFYQEQLFPGKNEVISVFNCFSERIEKKGSKRFLGTSMKCLHSKKTVLKLLKQEKFIEMKIKKTFSTSVGKVNFLFLRKK